MNKLILNTLVLTTLLTSSIALAEIPQEFLQASSGHTGVKQNILSQESDGTVAVSGAMRVDTLYRDSQMIELEIENLSFDKQIFVYDQAEMYEFDRAVKVRWVYSQRDLSLGDGVALYIGKTNNGRDRVLVNLSSTFRAKPAASLDIYVKMNGQQFQTRQVRFDN